MGGVARWVIVCVSAGLLVSCSQAPTPPEGQTPAQTGEKRFEPVGLGGGGGLYTPTGSPHDLRLLYVSCDMGGFYVSEDSGAHWRMTDKLQMRGSTSCRPAFSPIEANTVYMPYPNYQQLRVSRDKGKTWEVLCDKVPWGSGRVNAINIDPDSPALMFVATADGLYRSSDGGKSFVKCEGVTGSVIWTHLDRTSSKDSRVCIAGANEGVFVSNDGGKTWSKKGEGLPETINGFCGGSDAKSGKVICYASAQGAIYVSTDRGATFKKAEGTPDRNFNFVCVTESVPEVCYVTDSGRRWGVYKTEDGGSTWKNVYRFFADMPDKNVTYGWLATDISPSWGGDAGGFGVSQADPKVAMFTNSGELFITQDGGGSWRQGMSTQVTPGPPKPGDRWTSNGLEVTTTWYYVFDPHDRNRTYICYTDTEFARSTDRGETWYWAGKGSPWHNTFYQVVFDPDKPGMLYGAASRQHDIPGWTNIDRAYQAGGVVISTDYGANWSGLGQGLPSDQNRPCTSVALDPKSAADSRTLYCTMYGDGVYKSGDGGKTWQKKSNGLGRPGNMHVYVVRFGPDGALYCLITAKRSDMDFPVAGGLWRSTDGAETWTELTKDVDLWWPTEFAIHPTNHNIIYITTADVPQKNGGGLFASTDGGKTWKQQLSNKDFDPAIIAYVHNFGITFYPQNPDIIYLCSWTHGLQMSTDGGKTWKHVNGIPFFSTSRVTFDPEDPDVIYVTCFGGGVWKGPRNGY